MSAVGSSNPASQGPKAKKNNKKKKSTARAKTNGDMNKANGTRDGPELELDEDTVDAEEPKTPTDVVSNGMATDKGTSITTTVSSGDGTSERDEVGDQRIRAEAPRPSMDNTSVGKTDAAPGSSTTERRLENLSQERDLLRTEVESLRKSLEQIQTTRQQEIERAQAELDEANSEKEQAETQYQTLLGKVNTIKSQLGERLKSDRAELAQAREQMEELEDQNRSLKERNEALEAEVSKLSEEGEQRSKELSSLRNRTNLSQQNWTQERQDLISREAFAKEEFEAAKQAMQDWEILAMEERSYRENLTGRVSELEEQLSNQQEAYQKAASERDSQALTVDGLQRALQDIQDARKQELRDLVESNQAQVESLRKEIQEIEKKASVSEATLEATKVELDRARPFEKEVKEKSLLIGKLRHEAVILNDHLTKALRFLKKGKPEDNIDRQIVTNHFLHFLALDRADPKKFQVLQLIAALLNWTDDQREQAGLSRPGASNTSLRIPLSPFQRTPSTPALNNDLYVNNTTSKESLAELWSGFLEQEAQQGGKDASRPGSVSSSSVKPS